MTSIEKICGAVRHHPLLQNADRLWNAIRPAYNAAFSIFAAKGISKCINGTDSFRVSPKLRGFSEVYEPAVWRQVMTEVRPGDVFVDVGAFVGLYTLAVVRRVEKGGQVFAFEPDVLNYELLREHCRINTVSSSVVAENKAVGSKVGQVGFAGGRGLESRIETEESAAQVVDMVTLDSYFGGRKIDILKIDVEGFEQAVLEGAAALLSDQSRRPRAIFIEVHPFAWSISGATSDGLLALLQSRGYSISQLDGLPVSEIAAYGEIVARAHQGKPANSSCDKVDYALTS